MHKLVQLAACQLFQQHALDLQPSVLHDGCLCTNLCGCLEHDCVVQSPLNSNQPRAKLLLRPLLPLLLLLLTPQLQIFCYRL